MRCMHKLGDERDCRLWWCGIVGEDGGEVIAGG